ncbi:MAG: polysaccharide biosynthesis C-terminal domain-containing protein [Candidatus Nomurabacteria bacterium]|jgi:putative peptidoglycan lipid II flippase|nr:polysaccharide biosynthesis C-terminal domain-containing protein [Candidatus Nomurabacteria bacterium]
MSSNDEDLKVSVAGENSPSELLEHYTERAEKIAETKEKEQKQRRRNRALSAIARANSKIPVRFVAVLLASSTLISALLGIYRDRLLNGMYYDTYKTGIDAYTAAFSIPDFMFLILVSGALSVTFIPVFNSRLAKNQRESAWQLSSSLINFMALITLVASILIMIFAPLLVKYIVGPGMSEAGQGLATSMMRVIAINPFLFSISAIIASIQQAVGRFVFFATAPAIYNIGIIIGATWFTNGISIFGFQIFEGGIMGVALGVVLGAVLQLLVSSLGLIGLGFDYKFKIFWKNLGFRKVLSLLPARSTDQGLDYVNSMVGLNLASRMGQGTIRAYNQASTLNAMPINLIGVAISTAAFPQMTERIGQGRPDLFARELRAILRVIIWLAMPVAAIAFFARGYIVSIIARGGDQLIVTLFGILCLVILLRSVYHIAARSFYAQQDTRTPLLISLVSIFISIALLMWFVFGLNAGAVGIAWAQVIWAALEVVALFVLMARRIPNLFNHNFWSGIGRMFIATSIMSIGTYALVKLIGLEFAEQTMLMVLPQLAVIGLVSMAIYVGLSKFFHLDEATPVLNYVKKITLGKLWVGRKPS